MHTIILMEGEQYWIKNVLMTDRPLNFNDLIIN